MFVHVVSSICPSHMLWWVLMCIFLVGEQLAVPRNDMFLASKPSARFNSCVPKVCFKRLVQAGVNTIVTEETRVWEFVGSRWSLGLLK